MVNGSERVWTLMSDVVCGRGKCLKLNVRCRTCTHGDVRRCAGAAFSDCTVRFKRGQNDALNFFSEDRLECGANSRTHIRRTHRTHRPTPGHMIQYGGACARRACLRVGSSTTLCTRHKDEHPTRWRSAHSETRPRLSERARRINLSSCSSSRGRAVQVESGTVPASPK